MIKTFNEIIELFFVSRRLITKNNNGITFMMKFLENGEYIWVYLVPYHLAFWEIDVLFRV